MNQTIEAMAGTLADILTEYLSTSQENTAAGKPTIKASTNMVTELQLDSFQVMEFMLEVEDHYDVAIDLESLSNIQTISELANEVSRLVSQ